MGDRRYEGRRWRLERPYHRRALESLASSNPDPEPSALFAWQTSRGEAERRVIVGCRLSRTHGSAYSSRVASSHL